MAKITKVETENIVEFLNERLNIYDNMGCRNEDKLYYQGAVRALEIAGLNVEWIEERGTHVVY